MLEGKKATGLVSIIGQYQVMTSSSPGEIAYHRGRTDDEMLAKNDVKLYGKTYGERYKAVLEREAVM